jgi:hypothetical protein
VTEHVKAPSRDVVARGMEAEIFGGVEGDNAREGGDRRVG